MGNNSVVWFLRVLQQGSPQKKNQKKKKQIFLRVDVPAQEARHLVIQAAFEIVGSDISSVWQVKRSPPSHIVSHP
jgi:hypothetical protein